MGIEIDIEDEFAVGLVDPAGIMTIGPPVNWHRVIHAVCECPPPKHRFRDNFALAWVVTYAKNCDRCGQRIRR